MRSGEPWRSTWPPAGGNNRDIYWVLTHTKRPKRKRPNRPNVPTDQTSQRTKRPNGQNVPEPLGPRDKMSHGQNIPRTKRPKGKKRPTLIPRIQKHILC